MPGIKQIKTEEQLAKSLEVIRQSFRTVAEEMNVTRQKTPDHPAFYTMERLRDLHKKATFWGLYVDGNQVGFIASEKSEDGVYFMDRLSILPAYRLQGYGRKLVEYLLDYIRKQGGAKVALGMVNSQTNLKNWYKSFGFLETGTKQFEHLPFLVCFMEKDLSA
jgi:ribosomal protein S18 acetylase RimI-like enzyme